MVIPYYPKIVNIDNSDFSSKNKFLGFITPDGKTIGERDQYGKYDHLCYMPNVLIYGILFEASKMTKEQFFAYLNERRLDRLEHYEYVKNKDEYSRQHTLLQLRLIDYFLNFYLPHFNLNSSFMNKYLDYDSDFSADYLVQLLCYDKVERLSKTITTSKATIYEPFFNYLIMDFAIVQIPKVIFSEEIGDFGYYTSNDFIQFDSEKKAEQEVKLIKKSIPLEERPRYFR